MVWYLVNIADSPAFVITRVCGSRFLAYFGTRIPIYTVSHVKERFFWEDNINMDLKEVWCGYEDCICNVAHVTIQWRADVNKVMDCGGLS